MRSGKSEKVLLVDDEEEFLSAAADLFALRGFDVDTAEGGGEAIEKFGHAAAAYGTALVDLRMPGMSGIEVASEMHKIDPDVSISVLSAPAHIESFRGTAKSQHVSISNWWEKPLPVEDDVLDAFFAGVEIDVFRTTLRRQGRHDDLHLLDLIISRGAAPVNGILSLMRAYSLQFKLPLTEDLFESVRLNIGAVIADFPDKAKRLENMMILKASLKSLSRGLIGDDLTVLKDAVNLVYGALRNARAEELSKIQAQALRQSIEIISAGKVTSADVRKIDRILISADLDVIPDIRS